MFGDNLSMISDTTIAAVRTQGCEMKDKFRMNFLIVLPAAILTLVIFLALTWGGSGQVEVGEYSFWKVLPYLVVLVGAIIGVNVFIILMLGTALSLAVGVASGAFLWTDLFSVTFQRHRGHVRHHRHLHRGGLHRGTGEGVRGHSVDH